VLDNFRKAGALYVILTTFPGGKNKELSQSHPGWGWRPLDMAAAPYHLDPTPECVREDAAGEVYERWMRMFRL
jgi:hypothetical protein